MYDITALTAQHTTFCNRCTELYDAVGSRHFQHTAAVAELTASGNLEIMVKFNIVAL